MYTVEIKTILNDDTHMLITNGSKLYGRIKHCTLIAIGYND